MKNDRNVNVQNGYLIERVRTGLNTPVHLQMIDGSFYYGDSGLTDGNGKLIQMTESGERVIADGFQPPLTGITYHDNHFYVSHKGSVTKVTREGEKTDILVGLPSFGDYSNNRVTFGPDGKFYFGQGTATNSGVVGMDNGWRLTHPYFCDYPARDLVLTGENFESESILPLKEEPIVTGAFSPYGKKSTRGEVIRHILAGAGSILRADPDGSNLELVAWGLRNPYAICFDRSNQLYVTNQGMENRGSRPIKGAPDEFIQVHRGHWYGWPDYSGGYPVTMPFFKPEGKAQPEFLLLDHPMIPPHPMINFIPRSAISGFQFNQDPSFGFVGDAFIAEFGPVKRMGEEDATQPNTGHRITKVDMRTGALSVFVQNQGGLPASKSNTQGLERPIDIQFGEDHAMYILDYGIYDENINRPVPRTGTLWRVRRA